MKKFLPLLAYLGVLVLATFAGLAQAHDFSGLHASPLIALGGLIVTPTTLSNLQTAFNAAFKQGFGSAAPTWPLVAMEVPSTAKMETYGWMKDLPGMREWVGQRVINNLEAQGATLTNKKWEHTIGVQRTDIEDDQLGMYTLALQQQGEVVARHPNELVWGLLPTGFTALGMDGQYFFDADHVGYDSTGAEVAYSNTGGGAGAPWVLVDLSRAYMKPLIFQNREAPSFTAKTRPDDEHVFMADEYLYGAKARYVAGFGFHQLAFGSKAALAADTFAAARLAMETQRRPDGSPLPISPTHLITGPSNRVAAEALLTTQFLAAGANNPNYKAVELIIVPSLG